MARHLTHIGQRLMPCRVVAASLVEWFVLGDGNAVTGRRRD